MDCGLDDTFSESTDPLRFKTPAPVDANCVIRPSVTPKASQLLSTRSQCVTDSQADWSDNDVLPNTQTQSSGYGTQTQSSAWPSQASSSQAFPSSSSIRPFSSTYDFDLSVASWGGASFSEPRDLGREEVTASESVLNEAFMENHGEQLHHAPNDFVLACFDVLSRDFSAEPQMNSTVCRNAVDLDTVEIGDGTSAEIIANSISSLLLMGDGSMKRKVYSAFGVDNHLALTTEMTRILSNGQESNVERILLNKMRSQVWTNEEVQRSRLLLRLVEENESLAQTENVPEPEIRRSRRLASRGPGESGTVQETD